ncbi:MAG: hypothetical protein OSB44_07630 [Verrucomicrobiales bacterium]|nr:hypothetical protein [Verrucomicrobiales bacterium]
MMKLKILINRVLLIFFVALLFPSCKSADTVAMSDVRKPGIIRQILNLPLSLFVAKEAKYPTGEPTEFLTGFLWSVKPSDLDPDIAKQDPSNLVIAEAVIGGPGLVLSPHAPGLLVDVQKFSSGDEVICPHTGLSFIVPDNVEPVLLIADDMPTGRPLTEITEDLDDNPTRDKTDRTGIAENAQGVVEESKPDGLTAIRVRGKENQVFSPYTKRNYIVDITGLKSGDKARCPYTGRIFVIPEEGEDGRPENQQNKNIVDEAIAAISDKIEFRVLKKKQDSQTAKAAKMKKDTVPVATWSKRVGYVMSPFGGQLIDVRGKAVGSVLRCPFSGKLFKLPETKE